MVEFFCARARDIRSCRGVAYSDRPGISRLANRRIRTRGRSPQRALTGLRVDRPTASLDVSILANLFADHLDQDALGPATVELAIEDLFPRADVELAGCDRDYHL